MLKEFKQHIEKRFPELVNHPFLLACSGGVDSVVMAHLCARISKNFALAHCNFNLRGKASDEDEKFVQILARNLKVKYYSKHFETTSYVNETKVSLQMAARELRYGWFAQLMKEEGYKKLVTAHQSDDNLETFIINLSRGTGIEGLRGIPEKTLSIARPLLRFSREQLLTFAREQQIIWREDASNADTKYLRNRIRHEIVPQLRDLHPTFDKNFSKTLEYLAGSAAILDNHTKELKNRLFEKEKDHIKITIERLIELKPLKPYLHALFRDYGFSEWDDLHGLLTTLSGKEVRSGTHRLIKDRNCLLLQELAINENQKQEYFLDNESAEFPIPLVLTSVEKIDKSSKKILYLDKETLNDRLSVRKWKKGDYFYPLGMKGKKKLSKFFKDEKMDTISKEAQWLLCSGEDIVWVIGRRADDRFKVTDKTQTILKFSLTA